MAKRVAFVQHAATELGVRAEAFCARAEDLGRDPAWRYSADVVVCRSLAAPAVAAEYAAPLLKPGGFVLVAEPPGGNPERWSSEGLNQLGMAEGELFAASGATIQRIDQVSPCPDRFPRRVGAAAKRPLF